MRYAVLLALSFFSACSWFKVEDRFGAKSISFAALSGWNDDNHTEALAAFISSCPILAKKAKAESTGSKLKISEDVWRSLCDDALRAQGNTDLAKQFFEARFVPFRVNNNGKAQGLFTGYYEPVLYGSGRKTDDFIYPLYVTPPELKDCKPCYSRDEVDEGMLAGRRLELVWVDDPVMLFFLHIQGSGRVRFANGKEIRVGYAEQNGHPYAGLGKIMGDQGLIPKDQINFFTLRQWLYDNREQARVMMQNNPSYVFFRQNNDPGAIGAVGAILTPERSLAVDSRYIPYGLPLFLETDLPTEGGAPLPYRRLFIAQDTGGAIKGPVRGDIFFGTGDRAEYLAGYMKNRGAYTLLVPREIAARLR